MIKTNYSTFELENIVDRCLSKVIDIDDITGSTDLKEILDSLDYVEFIMELEQEFSISISDEIAEEIVKSKKTLVRNDIFIFLDKHFDISDIASKRKEKIDKIKNRWGFDTISI